MLQSLLEWKRDLFWQLLSGETIFTRSEKVNGLKIPDSVWTLHMLRHVYA